MKWDLGVPSLFPIRRPPTKSIKHKPVSYTRHPSILTTIQTQPFMISLDLGFVELDTIWLRLTRIETVALKVIAERNIQRGGNIIAQEQAIQNNISIVVVEIDLPYVEMGYLYARGKNGQWSIHKGIS